MNLQPDRRWEAFAEREPYFAVLTAPKYLRANLTLAMRREGLREELGPLLKDLLDEWASATVGESPRTGL